MPVSALRKIGIDLRDRPAVDVLEKVSQTLTTLEIYTDWEKLSRKDVEGLSLMSPWWSKRGTTRGHANGEWNDALQVASCILPLMFDTR